MGTRTNKVSKTSPTHDKLLYKDTRRTLKRMPTLVEPSPIVITCHKIEAAYTHYSVVRTFYL
jgi:hypothetical protein